MRYKIGGAAVCIAALLLVIPAYAHHPFSAEYDANKPVNMMGKITRIDWENPHAHIYMDVNGKNGQMEHWTLELANPKKLETLGWKKDSVKMGDEITVTGWQARDGSNRANVNNVTTADGKKMAAGSSYFENGNEKSQGKPTGNN